MSNVLTADKLLRTIKRRAFIPADDDTFTDDDLLEMLDEEINMFGVPHLLKTYDEYLVKHIDIVLEVGVDSYEIPYRAVGNKLRDLAILDNNENLYEMSRVRLDELSNYRRGYSNLSGYNFYVEDNMVKFVNEIPISQGSLRFYFYMRPNNIVKLAKVGKIASIDTTTGTVILESFPSSFANLVANGSDFVKERSPNIILDFDKNPISVDSNTNTIVYDPADLPDNLRVGDYVCNTQESPVPQLPAELHPILAQRVSIACLEAMGDMEGRQLAMDKLEKMEKSVNTIINNRVDGANEKINNRHSPLSQGINSGRARGKIY